MNHGYDSRALRLIGYARVSTAEQGESGLGMAAQHATIHQATVDRGWTLDTVVEEVRSAGNDRPRLEAVLRALDRHRGKAREADGLIVAKLDRLTRSVREFAELLERARANDWRLIILDLGVDTTTPAGEAMAGMVSVFAQFERRLIQTRTRDALRAAKDRGVKLGGPVRVNPVVADRIGQMYAEGHSMRAIAAALTRLRYATPDGGQDWKHSTVQRVIDREGFRLRPRLR